MAKKLNGKKNILIIIIIALLGFLLLSLANRDSEEDTMTLPINEATSTPETSVVEEPIIETEDDLTATNTEPQSLPESNDTANQSHGTGGPIIIGYDEEKFPIYGDEADTALAPPAQSSVVSDLNIISAGQTLLQNLDTTSDEVYEDVKPDLLELIEALEAFIEDLKAYIAYREETV